jgi:TP901 family phage tail tape measure protein
MTTVSSLDVLIGANISGLQRGLNQGNREISGFGGRIAAKFKGVGDSISGVGSSIMGLSAPIGQALGYGISVASDFEGSLAEISARTGVVGTDLDTVRQFALQMGADTAFSAQEASDGLLELLSSGQSLEDAMATLPAIMNAAAAGGMELGAAADMVTNIMASFGLGVGETADVVNILAAAAGASSADMAGMGDAFANVGGVAKNFGLDVEETAAILAIFADNGIKGAEAGTQLKSMLLNMSSDTAQAAFDELGVSLYDAQGNMRDFETVISELDTALDALPVEEQNRLMQDLAGSYGIVGFTALRGETSISEMTTAMGEQATAADVAQARMDTFGGKLDSLKGSVESLMINALTPLMDNVLKPLIEDLTKTVNSISDWASKNPELAGGIGVVAAGIAILGPLLIGVGTAVSAFGAAIAIITSPITVLVGAIAVLVGWLSSGEGGLGGALERARTTAEQLVQIGLLVLIDTLNRAATTVSQLAGIVGILLTGALTWVRDRFNELGTTITNLVDGGLQLFEDAVTGLQTVLADPLGALKGLFDGVFGWINTNVIQPFVGVLNGIGDTIEDLLQQFNLLPQDGRIINTNPGDDRRGQQDGGGDGFAAGGFTGFGASNEVAGVVHRGEWVVPQGGALVMRGDSGPTTIINKYYSVSSYGTSPRELLELLKREEASQGAG